MAGSRVRTQLTVVYTTNNLHLNVFFGSFILDVNLQFLYTFFDFAHFFDDYSIYICVWVGPRLFCSRALNLRQIAGKLRLVESLLDLVIDKFYKGIVLLR